MRRWISEPLLAGAIAIALYLTWMLLYSGNLANSGGTPSGGHFDSEWSVVVRLLVGIAVFAVPVVVWAGLAMIGGYLVRRRSFVYRLLTAWLAAVALCLPFVVASAASLTANDGWRGLGAVGFLIPIAATFAVIPLYCVAAAAVHLRGRRALPQS